MSITLKLIVLYITLATIFRTNDAQNSYENCSTNYTDLENALLETSDNTYVLRTTYFNPDVANPLYVNVYYNFSDSNTQAHYIWSAASLYLIVAPPAVGYLSLYFGYVHYTTITTLTLQLPAACAELTNVTSSTKDNFLFVLTQRLRIYAKYYHSMENMVLPDGFEARVVSYKNRDRFINESGVINACTFVFTLPLFVYILFVCYVRGTHIDFESIDKPENYAALVCVAQTYTLTVSVLDVVALSVDGITEYIRIFIILIAAVEFFLFFSIFGFVLIFILDKRDRCSTKALKCFFFTLLWHLEPREVKQWFVIVAFIPLLVCLSSHIGFIIEGWASTEEHGTAVMLFYALSFVYLYVIFQKVYVVVSKILSRQQKQQQQKHGINFCILFWEMILGIPLLGGFLVYVGFGFTHFPVVRGTEVVVTHIYNFGHTAFIFALFLLTYIVFYGRRGSSNGVVSRDMIKFWKYLNADQQRPTHAPEQEIRNLSVQSDTDKANALNAVFLFRLIQMAQGEGDHCEKLLSEILREGEKEREGPKGEEEREEQKGGEREGQKGEGEREGQQGEGERKPLLQNSGASYSAAYEKVSIQ